MHKPRTRTTLCAARARRRCHVTILARVTGRLGYGTAPIAAALPRPLPHA